MPKAVRLLMSIAWWVLVLPMATVAALLEVLVGGLNGVFHNMDPEWEPMHPLRSPPPPPADDEMPPTRADT